MSILYDAYKYSMRCLCTKCLLYILDSYTRYLCTKCSLYMMHMQTLCPIFVLNLLSIWCTYTLCSTQCPLYMMHKYSMSACTKCPLYMMHIYSLQHSVSALNQIWNFTKSWKSFYPREQQDLYIHSRRPFYAWNYFQNRCF